jgi:DNA mismatch endonuclease (patch repair protein)
VDRISREQRSRNMQRIRCADTSPELAVRRMVCELGFRSRYRLCDNKLPGRPDLVFCTLHRIIFVHGCFWHSHKDCRLAHVPASKTAYWRAKLARNRKRDGVHLRELRRRGWEVLVIWECQLEDTPRKIRGLIAGFLKRRR